MCQVDWAQGCPHSWSNGILGCVCEVVSGKHTSIHPTGAVLLESSDITTILGMSLFLVSGDDQPQGHFCGLGLTHHIFLSATWLCEWAKGPTYQEGPCHDEDLVKQASHKRSHRVWFHLGEARSRSVQAAVTTV